MRYSDYLSRGLCELLDIKLSPQLYDEILDRIDAEIEYLLEDVTDCDDCDERMGEPSYNEGYL